jgi:hypothetical protein
MRFVERTAVIGSEQFDPRILASFDEVREYGGAVSFEAVVRVDPEGVQPHDIFEIIDSALKKTHGTVSIKSDNRVI